MNTPHDKAVAFRRLHAGPRVLVLPNVWDVVSARIVELAGFPALATSSAGVAWALGYPDGQRISRGEMTAVVAAGAVGMNLEDAAEREGELVDVALQVERIRAAREAATATPIVINARTDVFLSGIGEPATRLAHAVKRLGAYHAAGADSLFCPGVKDAPTIAALARELAGPLNILAGPGAPPIPELERLGVRRVSLGAQVMRAALGAVRRVAAELGGPGTYTAIAESAVTDDINRLLAGIGR